MRTRLAATLTSPALTLVLIATAATGARAQTVSLIGKAGGYVPVNETYDLPGELQLLTIDRKAQLSIGGAIQVSPMFWPVDVRLGVDYLTGTEIGVESPTTGPGAAVATLLMFSGDVVLRPFPRLIFMQPFMLAGVGYKRETFDAADASTAVPGDYNDYLFHLGLGLDVGLGPIDVVAEVSDYFSGNGSVPGQGLLDSRHDVFATVGLKVGLF